MDDVIFSRKKRKNQPLESLQVDKMSRLTAGVVAVGEDSGAGGGGGGRQGHVGARPHLQFHAPAIKNHSRGAQSFRYGYLGRTFKKACIRFKFVITPSDNINHNHK